MCVYQYALNILLWQLNGENVVLVFLLELLRGLWMPVGLGMHGLSVVHEGHAEWWHDECANKDWQFNSSLMFSEYERKIQNLGWNGKKRHDNV